MADVWGETSHMSSVLGRWEPYTSQTHFLNTICAPQAHFLGHFSTSPLLGFVMRFSGPQGHCWESGYYSRKQVFGGCLGLIMGRIVGIFSCPGRAGIVDFAFEYWNRAKSDTTRLDRRFEEIYSAVHFMDDVTL